MPRRTIILAAFLILLSGAAVALATILDNTGVAYGGTSTLTGPDGVCKTVTNNSPTGKQVYVPGSTAAEWQSFVASPPTGVSLTSCSGWQPGRFCSGAVQGMSYFSSTQSECATFCDQFSNSCCTWEGDTMGAGFGNACFLHEGTETVLSFDHRIVGSYISPKTTAGGICPSWPAAKRSGPMSNINLDEEINWYFYPWYGYTYTPVSAANQATCKHVCELAGAKNCSYMGVADMNEACWWSKSGASYNTSGLPWNYMVCTP